MPPSLYPWKKLRRYDHSSLKVDREHCVLLAECLKYNGAVNKFGQEESVAKSTTETKSKKAARKARRRQQSPASVIKANTSKSENKRESTMQPDCWQGARLPECYVLIFNCFRGATGGSLRCFIQRFINHVIMDVYLDRRFRSFCTARLAAMPDHQGMSLSRTVCTDR